MPRYAHQFAKTVAQSDTRQQPLETNTRAVAERVAGARVSRVHSKI
jgi:hypothetical protein